MVGLTENQGAERDVGAKFTLLLGNPSLSAPVSFIMCPITFMPHIIKNNVCQTCGAVIL